MTYPKNVDSCPKFVCQKCDFKCFKKGDYTRHINTIKHKRTTNTYFDAIDFIKNKLTCECGKTYKHKQSLFNHKKTCTFKENKLILTIQDNMSSKETNETNETNEELKELVCKLITENIEIKNTILKENQELRKQVSELIPRIGNNNNTIKQKFNINVFLNEQCKDAINMNDFINSIEISLDQLDYTKKHGLCDGLSNAILQNMNKLSLHERPMHCTDIKRETLYIKDDDKWKRDETKNKIKKAIKKVSVKNYGALKNWKTENPDFIEHDTKQDYFAHVISTIGKPLEKVDPKVIKNLCKETYIKDDK